MFLIHNRISLYSTRMASSSLRTISSIVADFETSVAALPHREVIRYVEKNTKWTAGEFNQFVDEHAAALIDLNFKAGTRVAVWLPECKEKHIFLMAAAKVGLVVIDIDTNITAVPQVREALDISQATLILFDTEPKDDDSDRLMLLRKSIPEFYEYDDSQGQWFHSKYYPSLKYFLHTGFDIQLGCLNFKHWFLNNPTDKRLDARKNGLTSDMPLYCQILAGQEALKVSPLYTSQQVQKQKLWGFYEKILNKEYFEL